MELCSGTVPGVDLVYVLVEGTKWESWAAFTEALGSVAGDVPANKRNAVEDRTQDFGNEREETGFRLGLIDDEKTKLSVDDRVTNVTPNVMTNDGQMSTRDRDRERERDRDKELELEREKELERELEREEQIIS